jgi:hypothetical protein
METELMIAGISIAINIVFGVIGYLVRDKVQKMETRQEELNTRLMDVQLTYVLKEDMNKMKDEMNARFDKLENLILKVR